MVWFKPRSHEKQIQTSEKEFFIGGAISHYPVLGMIMGYPLTMKITYSSLQLFAAISG